jgi:hypothetical protein
MANDVNFSGQGEIMIAEVRNGVPVGGFRKIGTADKFEISIDQTFDDIYETKTGSSFVEDHTVTKSTTKVTINMKKWSVENLVAALYGSSAGAQIGGTVTAEVQKGYNGSFMNLAHQNVSSVVLKVGATPTTLVAGVDYVLDAKFGTVEFLAGSTLVTDDGVDVSAAYTYAAYAGKVESFTGAIKEYWVRLNGVNRVDPTAPVVVDCYRVSLNMTKMMTFIDDKHSALPMEGMALLDATRPVGTSNFFTVTKS